MSDQWRENRVYQDILDLYIRHTYVQNFRLLATHEGKILKYINSLNNFPPKVNSLEELTLERFMLEEERQKQYQKDLAEMFRLYQEHIEKQK